MHLITAGLWLKILHVISELQTQKGGPTIALLGFVKAQLAIGSKPVVVWTSKDPKSSDESATLAQLNIPFVKIAPCHTNWLFSFNTNSMLRKLIQEADVVHGHGVFEHILFAASKLAKEMQKPFVLRTCGILDRHSFRKNWLKKNLYLWLVGRHVINRASALHLLTDFESKNLHPMASSRPQVILPNGVDIPRLPSESGAVRTMAAGAPFILFLGRLHPKKGIDLLLKSFPKLSRSDLKLVIVGDGDDQYVNQLKGLAASLGISSRVSFLGAKFDAEKFELMRAASCMVLPSRDENFANVVIEALAVGTPVIVSEQVGLATFVQAKQLGAVCKLDVDDIAHKISTLDVGDRASFSTRALKIVKENFSWNEIARTWQERYTKMLEECVK